MAISSTTISSGFFDSLESSPRRYTAEEFSSIFDGLIQDGVYESYKTNKHFQVSKIDEAGTLKVSVEEGRGWFNHVWVCNTSTVRFTLDPALSSASRKDAIVICVNKDSRASSLVYYPGKTDGTNTTNIPADTSTVFYYPIVNITVPKNATNISQCTLTNTIGDGYKTKYVKTIVNPSMTLAEYIQEYNNQVQALLDALTDDIHDWQNDVVDNMPGIEQADVAIEGQIQDLRSDLEDEIEAREAATGDATALIDTKISAHNTSSDPHANVLNPITSSIATLQRKAITNGPDRIAALEGYFTTDLKRYGQTPMGWITLNAPPFTIARYDIGTGTIGGGKPDASKMGNYIIVISMTTNPAAKYNVQVAFGTKYTMAMRCDNGKADSGKTKWDNWKYYTFK